MHLNISQQMKMSQQMKLAPRMIQSMEILQLNMMALNERIEQELVENVTLERVEKERDTPVAEPTPLIFRLRLMTVKPENCGRMLRTASWLPATKRITNLISNDCWRFRPSGLKTMSASAACSVVESDQRRHGPPARRHVEHDWLVRSHFTNICWNSFRSSASIPCSGSLASI
jgi:DNA-directed RNA polymerase specialized sigma54-like protein